MTAKIPIKILVTDVKKIRTEWREKKAMQKIAADLSEKQKRITTMSLADKYNYDRTTINHILSTGVHNEN